MFNHKKKKSIRSSKSFKQLKGQIRRSKLISQKSMMSSIDQITMKLQTCSLNKQSIPAIYISNPFGFVEQLESTAISTSSASSLSVTASSLSCNTLDCGIASDLTCSFVTDVRKCNQILSAKK